MISTTELLLLPTGPQAFDEYSLKEIASRIHLNHFPWPINLRVDGDMVNVEMWVSDRDNGQTKMITFAGLPTGHVTWWTGKDKGGKDWTPREAVAHIYDTIREAVLHELDEAFHYCGERVFDPHEREKREAKERVVRPRSCVEMYGCKRR